MTSAHFVNRRVDTSREGLTRVGGDTYRSCCWALSDQEAASLVGGWIYLHETKAQPAAFGGVVLSVEAAERQGTARAAGYALTFRARAEARGRRWRGSEHSMAWWSGLVEATAEHER